MKLQTRLLLSHGYLVTLVLIGAAGAALGFYGLGNRIGQVLDGNFESVRASMEMLEALERQDSAVLTALLEFDHPRVDVELSERVFLDALDRARANLTEEDERPALEAIARQFDDYRVARDRLLSSPSERPLAEYEGECSPQFESVKERVRGLLDLNHRAMVRADRETQSAAAKRALGYALLTAIALISLGSLSRDLRVNLISGLDELRSVSQAIEHGDLRRRASAQRTDELGAVARAVNGLLDAHEELSGRSQVRETRLRELLLGSLDREGRPAAIVSLGGDVVASTFEEAETRLVTSAAAALRRELSDDIEAIGETRRDVECDGRSYRFRLLVVGKRRAVGWWVTTE